MRSRTAASGSPAPSLWRVAMWGAVRGGTLRRMRWTTRCMSASAGPRAVRTPAWCTSMGRRNGRSGRHRGRGRPSTATVSQHPLSASTGAWTWRRSCSSTSPMMRRGRRSRFVPPLRRMGRMERQFMPRSMSPRDRTSCPPTLPRRLRCRTTAWRISAAIPSRSSMAWGVPQLSRTSLSSLMSMATRRFRRGAGRTSWRSGGLSLLGWPKRMRARRTSGAGSRVTRREDARSTLLCTIVTVTRLTCSWWRAGTSRRGRKL
mmetsp:Transcript_13596/g.29436  ORF Transcript_13596/g.29436 Transcript_13596/m.29436 type:complete len:260 (+) Transcript_13596:531-1310(+)